MKEEIWDFDEKEVEAFLKNKIEMEDIPVPDSLLPESIKGMLEEKTKEKPERKLSQNYFRLSMLGTAAAAILLVLLLPKMTGNGNQRSGAGALPQSPKQQTSALLEEEAYDGMPMEASQETTAGVPRAAGGIWMPESYEQVFGLLTNAQTSQIFKYSMNLEEDDSPEGFAQLLSDGEFLYAYEPQARQTKILSVREGETEAVSEVSADTEGYVKKIYQEDNLLVEIKSQEAINQTDISVYDISNRKEPVLVNSLEQDGSYIESHLEDGYLYVFSDFTIDAGQADVDNVGSYIPDGEGIPVMESQIYVAQSQQPSGFLFMTGTSLEEPLEFTDTAAVLMDNRQLCIKDSQIYIYGSSAGSEADGSELLTFACEQGVFQPGASVWLPVITGEAAVLEADKGKLYMLLDRRLYIVDENLVLTEAPGISEPVDVFYIWKEDTLLTASNGAEGTSVVLSMYDISDTDQIHSLNHMEFPQYTYGEIFDSPELLTQDPENGLIGFTLSGFENGYEKCYEVVAYEENQGFKKIFSHSFTEEEGNPGRGIFLKDYLYLPFQGGEIKAWLMK